MINEEVFMFSPQLRLIPYLSHHVPHYHAWMCNPALLAATESEPLSLEEEFENQLAWLQSMAKLTFLLAAPLPESPHERAIHDDEKIHQGMVRREGPFPSKSNRAEGPQGLNPEEIRQSFPLLAEDDYVSWGSTSADDISILPNKGFIGQKPLPGRYIPSQIKNIFTGEPIKASSTNGSLNPGARKPYFVMIGDCNLFLLNDEDEERENNGTTSSAPMDRRVFEVEVMIAYEPYRQKGLATRALRMLIQYAISVLGGTDFVAKILENNTPSIELFKTKLGFTEFKRVRVFNEIHYSRSIYTTEEKQNWKNECAALGCSDCWSGPYTQDVEQNMVLLAQNPSFKITTQS
ncbi:unnamed protein product [Phytomonas sp. Hart1]|nr:unnamed protein product [Phytomonas sp. Hart1]|eukprot:CCW72121.1 unnamed protein product [Phytomonas sp. isolate Hart1]